MFSKYKSIKKPKEELDKSINDLVHPSLLSHPRVNIKKF